ncbi:MAG TPA: hypothetical protein VNK05_01545, partial [Chloroflexota bacterium]|nr:hypothetical protein [Chloroflexota bacterium]
MTRIEADAILGAPPSAVWELLVDHERWPEWFRPAEGAAGPEGSTSAAGPEGSTSAAGEEDGGRGRDEDAGGLRLETVALVAGAPDRVGTERTCSAVLRPLPVPLPRAPARGARRLCWTDRIADVHAPWLLALDVDGARPPFRRARLRLILVEGAPGQTRLRLRLTYAPGVYWPLDVLWLRREVAGGLRRALDGLHARYPVRRPRYEGHRLQAQPAGVLAHGACGALRAHGACGALRARGPLRRPEPLRPALVVDQQLPDGGGRCPQDGVGFDAC